MGRVLAQGQLFAGYQIERLLGAGGMGEVYLARDRDLPRMIALKVLGRAVSDDADVRSRFMREADTVARLSHPNIVGVYARGEDEGQLWMAMQYVEGTDLTAELAAGPLAPDRAVHIVTEVAKALDRAHESGVLHRDVKPANILLAGGSGGQVFLADFGIAKILDQVGEATRTGQLYASLRYAAPEQFESTAVLDRRVDVYALGGTLHHLLTGTAPYPGETPAQLLHGHLNLPVPQPSSQRPGLPGGFDQVVTAALAKNPDDRFATCGELAAAAQHALAGHPVQTRARTASAVGQQSFSSGSGQRNSAANSSDNAGATTTIVPRGRAAKFASEPIAVAAPETSRRQAVLGRIAMVLAWLALLTAVAGLALHYTAWQSMFVVLAASFASYLMLGSVFAAALFAIVRQWRSAAGALAVVAAALWTQFPMMWPDGTAPAGLDITVMQSNILFGHADPDAVVKTVRDNGVEVLTLEELTTEAVERLRVAGLEDALPYFHLEPDVGGLGSGVFSKYPLQDASKLPGYVNNNIRATLVHPERGPITVFQFHPVPANLNHGAWQNEMRMIRDLLDQQPGQVIVGGDFNATYDHSAYRDLLRGRYADAAELLGVGALPTWPDDQVVGPLIGIDRVLIAGGHATRIRSVSIPGSDHRAVVARLRL